jgi:hypothetical protein
MFETSDVHPDIINAMKVFDRVIVPFKYLKNILTRHGVNATSINFYTSELIRMKPTVIPKKKNPDKIIFLYIGTNDIRKNLISLTKVFAKVAIGTHHKLIVKTNVSDNLTMSPNITVITEKISLERLAGLYNVCDYVISFTHGEGVGLPMIEASYFNKPILSHDQGVFENVKKVVKVPWHVLPTNEVSIDTHNVPDFLKKVFYGTWWEVDEEKAFKVINEYLNKRMKLSYAICACNEHIELTTLLHFLVDNKDPEDEICVLVDATHVTQQVRNVLEKFSNYIIHCEREFDGDFSAHRNYHTTQCSGDFIFIIDADEIPQEMLIKNIKNIINETGGDLFYVPRINICPGYTEKWLKSHTFSVNEVGWINWPDWQGRVMKNDASIRWGNKLHERINGATKPIQLNSNPQLALWHIKTVQRQDLQDSHYKEIS